MKAKDLTGLKFNRLTVTSSHGANKHGSIQWNCLCECGKTSVVTSSALNGGYTKSCGCLQKEKVTKHGLTSSRTNNIWRGMNQRCKDKNSKDYAGYGAIGINVCDRWSEFSNFLSDMGVCPTGMTLEREDNSKSYSPENCKWATWKEQAQNRRNNHKITVGSETLLISEWAKRLGVGDSVIPKRLKRGWSAEIACLTPVKPRKRPAKREHSEHGSQS